MRYKFDANAFCGACDERQAPGVQHLTDYEQRLAEFHRLAILDKDLLDHAGSVSIDLIQEFHGLYDAQGLTFLDSRSDLDERRRSGGG